MTFLFESPIICRKKGGRVAIYYVDVNVVLDFGTTTLEVYPSGTGVGNPKRLNAGDQVGFRYTSAGPGVTITAAGFNSTHWTNTSTLTLTTSYQYKTASATIPSDSADTIAIVASRLNWTSGDATVSFIGPSTPSDTTVTPTSSTIPSTDTSASTTVSDVTVGEYYAVRVNNGLVNLATELASTTSVTITFSSELPTTIGVPVIYEIYSMRPVSLGGTGVYTATDDTFTVTTYQVGLPPIEPPIDSYGLAVYDNTGAFITSFSQGYSVLRTIFKTTVTLSPSGYTDIATGLTGLSNSNCVIQVRLEGSTGSILSVSTTFISGTTVRIAPYSAVSVIVTVLQYAGSSIGVAVDAYGIEIRNGNNSIVIDEGALTYGVKEIINGADTRVTTGTQISSNAKYGRIELTQGDYPSSNGVPAAAINCIAAYPLIPPSIGATTWPDGSYRYVYFFIPVAASYSSYNIAMLLPSNIATPSYYNAADTYGLDIRNPSGQLIWSSAWRQAIVNNVVPINIFSDGVSQNGTYDVTVGADGVTPPPLTQIKSEFIEDLTPVGESVGVSSLNPMDPVNTYLLGDASSGKVSYYTGKYWYDDFAYDYRGGGVFVPAASILSSTSVSIKMWRQFFPGFNAPAGVDESSRDTNSKHPEGNFIFLRIV